jgi:hypothetical protein
MRSHDLERVHKEKKKFSWSFGEIHPQFWICVICAGIAAAQILHYQALLEYDCTNPLN